MLTPAPPSTPVPVLSDGSLPTILNMSTQLVNQRARSLQSIMGSEINLDVNITSFYKNELAAGIPVYLVTPLTPRGKSMLESFNKAVVSYSKILARFVEIFKL